MIATLLTLRPVYLPHTTHIKFEALSPLGAGPRLLFRFLLASLKIPHIVVPKKVQSPLSFLPMCIDLPSVLLATGRITNHLQPTSRMHIHSAATHYHEQHCQMEIREPRTQTPDPRPSSRERDARQTHPEGNMQGSRLNSRPRAPIQVPIDRRAPNSIHAYLHGSLIDSFVREGSPAPERCVVNRCCVIGLVFRLKRLFPMVPVFVESSRIPPP